MGSSAMQDYVEVLFGIVFLAVGVWETFYPERAHAHFVHRGASTRTAFGSDPKWIIRVTGVMFLALALFMLSDALRSVFGR